MKVLGLNVVIGVTVVLSGCGTGRVSESEVVSVTTTETAIATKIVETTTVSSTPALSLVPVSPMSVNAQPTSGCEQQVPAGQGVDILQGAKRPCGTIAADAPKFVTPEHE